MTFEEWAKGYFGEYVNIPAAFLSAWNASKQTEREACAKTCEELTAHQEDNPSESFAASIRARNK